MNKEKGLVEMELSRILISENIDEQIIVLKEVDGDRAFPILIGIYEAVAIDRKIKGVKPQRPLTHDLLECVITALGASLVKVIVDSLADHTFYAKLVIKTADDKTIKIDCRPSDAVAVAVRADSPIFVAESVIEDVTGSNYSL